jgi:Rod binding domain-containing protein
MNLSPISAKLPGSGYSPAEMAELGARLPSEVSAGSSRKSPEDVARQFEAILVRQMLEESMKPLLEGAGGGHMYGYFISEALADGITKGGGLGLRSILEAQLRLQDSEDKAPRDP